MASATVTDPDRCDLDEFRALVETDVSVDDYPCASGIERGALVYDSERLRADLTTPGFEATVRNEIARALSDGPGIIVLSGALAGGVVDPATTAFEALIEDQRRSDHQSGDHYAKPGANDRVWNALEKLAVHAPEVFVDYYSNDMLALGCLAWLGPNYQITSQVNVVNPGGEAQVPHRDYHLGFMTDQMASRYPVHAHRLSPVLTLQGAVAHCDMPVESGPTMYLPHSQKYDLGYLAWRRPEFVEYFADRHVQVPLAKGDAVFFSPAMFHGAGTNRTTDVRRMANLLQIGSAMGRTLEAVDRHRVVTAIYPALLDRAKHGIPDRLLGHAIAAAAEGYAFPTNLDRDPPLDGLTPPSQADLVLDALAERLDPEDLGKRLDEHAARRRTH